MAMRTVARRWPGASQVRAVLRSGRQQEQQQLQQQQRRAYASEEGYTGKGLEEKEKAAENRYIRQAEEERRLKKASAAEASAGQSPVSIPGKVTSADGAASDSGFRNTAVVGGLLAAVVAGYWWFSGSGSSKKEEKESS